MCYGMFLIYNYITLVKMELISLDEREYRKTNNIVVIQTVRALCTFARKQCWEKVIWWTNLVPCFHARDFNLDHQLFFFFLSFYSSCYKPIFLALFIFHFILNELETHLRGITIKKHKEKLRESKCLCHFSDG